MNNYPKICHEFVPDEGYYFGLGVFETMLYKNGRIQLLDLHLKRMTESAAALGMISSGEEAVCADHIWQELAAFLKETGKCRNPQYDNPIMKGNLQDIYAAKNDILPDNLMIGKDILPDNTVIKIAWSGDRLFCTVRPNNYTEEQYERGFALEISPIRRNETSLFTYHKTLNYGDNILEKRRAHREGFDEPIFLNSRGEVAEGATTNIFFVTEEGIFTPPVEAGLLNGTVRQHLLMSDLYIRERSMVPEKMGDVKEVFVTNALLGLMPVCRLGNLEFENYKVASEIMHLFSSSH